MRTASRPRLHCLTNWGQAGYRPSSWLSSREASVSHSARGDLDLSPRGRCAATRMNQGRVSVSACLPGRPAFRPILVGPLEADLALLRLVARPAGRSPHLRRQHLVAISSAIDSISFNSRSAANAATAPSATSSTSARRTVTITMQPRRRRKRRSPSSSRARIAHVVHRRSPCLTRGLASSSCCEDCDGDRRGLRPPTNLSPYSSSRLAPASSTRSPPGS